MSALAIAAVTSTLRAILQNSISTGSVTTLPPDKAATAPPLNKLNLFLYHMSINSAWRNQYIPTKVKPGEDAVAPLPLNLYYMISAYGDDQTEESDHQLLGRAMLTLHDHAVLTATDIQNAASTASLKSAALDRQFEQVKLTFEPLSLEEMSKLWTTFQTQYRVSAAYQASVVLIESNRQPKSPLPVLKRGSEDRGPVISAAMPAMLEGIEYRDLRTNTPGFSAAQLGETITLLGRLLPGRRCNVLFIDPRRQATANNPTANIVASIRPDEESDDTRLYVTLDSSIPTWVSGPLSVQLEELPPTNAPPPPRLARSNALRFAMAPSLLLGNNMPFALPPPLNGRRLLVLNCHPGISRDATNEWPNVSLLLTPLADGSDPGPIPMPSTSDDVSSNRIIFDVTDVQHGKYRVRIRVEAVESLVMARNGLTFAFDDRQVVTL